MERKDWRREAEVEVKEWPTSLTVRENERRRERRDEGEAVEEKREGFLEGGGERGGDNNGEEGLEEGGGGRGEGGTDEFDVEGERRAVKEEGERDFLREEERGGGCSVISALNFLDFKGYD
ncbi:hypothetical protein Acr_07g0003070 [Actinidia rufa]|uniref:Uncharacterized protein n=1 Tax=Actinidia rufa TaxID=165716 RepID=A0A7J0EUS4_9ERIC|nr:hypothetical protein Acr_07g0003070 [Actinidia rufa]